VRSSKGAAQSKGSKNQKPGNRQLPFNSFHMFLVLSNKSKKNATGEANELNFYFKIEK